MTKRRDLEHHRNSLAEIGEILASMKTLAYMETRKLARFLTAQQQTVESIEDVAADFLGFFPGLPAAVLEATPVLLVIGSERGFCGDFNRSLIGRLSEARKQADDDRLRVVAVGHKLHGSLEGDRSVAAYLDGASVADEVPSVLQGVIDALNTLQASSPSIALFGIYHDNEDVELTALLPPFQQQNAEQSAHAFPPILNVPAETFLRELVDHYLFAALNNLLYTSLMSENQRRVAHLDGAVRRLDQQTTELTRKVRALRQEEIVEEIEVILLSASGFDGDPI
jgi:F-type H+-transporting ATPase subunit gamma